MRVLYLDIDTLRADHLGCYGYPRDTSPNLDAAAVEGVRFQNCYVSDAPCLPSRASLFTGRFGQQHGLATAGYPLHRAERVRADLAIGDRIVRKVDGGRRPEAIREIPDDRSQP